MKERGIVFVQILILILGFVCAIYFVGNEIVFVTAEEKDIAKESVTGVGASGAIAVAKPDSTYISNFLGTGYKEGAVVNGKTLEAGSWKIAGSGVDALASGLQWAVVAYFAGE